MYLCHEFSHRSSCHFLVCIIMPRVDREVHLGAARKIFEKEDNIYLSNIDKKHEQKFTNFGYVGEGDTSMTV